jgi:hypothetical protein
MTPENESPRPSRRRVDHLALLVFGVSMMCGATGAHSAPIGTGRRNNDFDGDGKSDFAVWQAASGTWTIRQSKSATTITPQWGAPEDIPVPTDYDGDGKADFATWKPATGIWTIRQSTNATTITPQWGSLDDIPVPADYDGDGKDDVAIWDPPTGKWSILSSAQPTVPVPAVQWGAPEDTPLPLGIPVWPWSYPPVAPATTSVPAVPVPDSLALAQPDLWEFSAVVAPPGTAGCPDGRRFLSGGGTGNHLLSADLTCQGANCDSERISLLPMLQRHVEQPADPRTGHPGDDDLHPVPAVPVHLLGRRPPAVVVR